MPTSFSLRRIGLPPLTALMVAALSVAGTPGTAAALRHRPRALSLQAVSLHESIHASLVSHRGATSLTEHGHGSGTFNCSLTIQITISYTQAKIEYTCTTSGGVMSGAGVVSYYVSGPGAHFKGALHFTHGAGRYARVSGSAGNISGSLARGNYALSAVVTGKINI